MAAPQAAESNDYSTVQGLVRGLEVMVGHVLAANEPMLALCKRLGFQISDHPQDSTVRRAALALASRND